VTSDRAELITNKPHSLGSRLPLQAWNDMSTSLFETTLPDLTMVVEETTPELPARSEQPAEASAASGGPLLNQARISLLGKALFPTSKHCHFDSFHWTTQVNPSLPASAATQGPSQALKRLSLPTQVLGSNQVDTSKRPSQLPQPGTRRRSHSPNRAPQAHTRHLSLSASASSSSSSAHNATTTIHPTSNSTSHLDGPLLAQLHALKSRHVALESSHHQLKSSQSSDLFRATARIASLEAELAKAAVANPAQDGALQQEAEGWEAEAKQLEKQLARAERKTKAALAYVADKAARELEAEKARKRRYKEMNEKLRCELVGRRLAHRWEIGLIDQDDRKKEQDKLKDDVDAVRVEMQLALARLEAEETHELVARQATKVSDLTASRAKLLSEHATINNNLASLKTEIATLKGSTTGSKKELASRDARIASLEGDVECLQSQVEAAAQGDAKADQKAAAEAHKLLDKEKAKREKAETEAKELKAALKEARAELKVATTAAAKAHKTPAVATSPKIKAKAKTKAPPSPAVESAVDDDGEIELPDAAADDSSEGEPEPKARRKPKQAATSAATKPSTKNAISGIDGSSADDPEGCQPAKSKSRAVPINKRKAAPSPVESEAEEEALAKPERKKKAVLVEKEANVKTAEKKETVTIKKVLARAAEPVVAVAVEVEEAQPAKKKKRTLFGGPKKFDWGAIEVSRVSLI